MFVSFLCFKSDVLYLFLKLYKQLKHFQGGIGPSGLSTEDLHVLDLTQPRPRWHRYALDLLNAV